MVNAWDFYVLAAIVMLYWQLCLGVLCVLAQDLNIILWRDYVCAAYIVVLYK